MSKNATYIAARRAGSTDAEANALAGYEGRTPSSVIKEWDLLCLLLQERNAWGVGPREVDRMYGAIDDEELRILNRQERDRERLRQLRLMRRVRGYASQSRDASEEILQNSISPTDTGDEAG